MSVGDIRKLVEQERDSEQKIKEAKQEAENVIRKSQEEAKKILEEAEHQKYYDGVLAAGLKEISEKKKLLENETEKKIGLVRKTAKKNLERTASLIVRHVLKE